MSELAENIVQLRGELQSLEGSLHKTRLTWASELEAFDAAKASKLAEIASVEKRLASLQGECREAEARRDAAKAALAPIASEKASLEKSVTEKNMELASAEVALREAEAKRGAAIAAASAAEKRSDEAKATLAETERIGTEQKAVIARMSREHGERVRLDREKLDAERAAFEASIAPREAKLAEGEKLVAKRVIWINANNSKFEERKLELEFFHKKTMTDLTVEPFDKEEVERQIRLLIGGTEARIGTYRVNIEKT